MLVSTCAAIGGIVIAAFVTAASPTPSPTILFEALTAVALSGMPLTGGRGSLPRVLVGALIIQTIASALTIKGVRPYWSTLFTGVLLLVGLAVERLISAAVANRVAVEGRRPAARKAVEDRGPAAREAVEGKGSNGSGG